MMRQLGRFVKEHKKAKEKVNEMVAQLVAENVGLSVGYEDQLALARDVSAE